MAPIQRSQSGPLAAFDAHLAEHPEIDQTLTLVELFILRKGFVVGLGPPSTMAVSKTEPSVGVA